MKELYQTADWKAEKHVPVIEISKKGDMYHLSIHFSIQAHLEASSLLIIRHILTFKAINLNQFPY